MDAALEYAPKIRVNCVSPGVIDTNLTKVVMDDPGLKAAVAEATPLRRVGTAPDGSGTALRTVSVIEGIDRIVCCEVLEKSGRRAASP